MIYRPATALMSNLVASATFAFLGIASVASASPIAGGPCNSGGTLTEFVTLSAPCKQGTLYFNLLTQYGPYEFYGPGTGLPLNDPMFLAGVNLTIQDLGVDHLKISFSGSFYSQSIYLFISPILREDPSTTFAHQRLIFDVIVGSPNLGVPCGNFQLPGESACLNKSFATDNRPLTAMVVDVDYRYVPEPATFGLAAIALGALARRKANPKP